MYQITVMGEMRFPVQVVPTLPGEMVLCNGHLDFNTKPLHGVDLSDKDFLTLPWNNHPSEGEIYTTSVALYKTVMS